MLPEFSSTIFVCLWKNGTSVAHTNSFTGSPSKLSTIAAPSADVTFLYRTPLLVETSGPSEHSPMQPTPFTRQQSFFPRLATSWSNESFTAWLSHDRHPAATQTFM